MSSRFVRALAEGDLRITNREPVSVGIELVKIDESGKLTKSVRTFRPGREVNLTRLYTVEELRKSPHLKKVIQRRAIVIRKTWDMN